MPTATEVVFLQLKDGINIEDTSSTAADLWKKCVQVIAAQPGFEGMYWVSVNGLRQGESSRRSQGTKVEDPKIAVATIGKRHAV